MLDQKYFLHEKTSVLEILLKEDFGLKELTDEQVRYITAVLISIHDSVQIPQEELVAWFMKIQDGYTTPIGETSFSISFTDAGLDILRDIALNFVEYIISPDTAIGDLLISCGRSLIKNSYYVEDKDERCVYLKAVRWRKEHPNRVFTVEDLLDGLKESDGCYRITISDELSAELTEKEVGEKLVHLAKVKVLNKYNDSFEFRI